MIWLLLYLLVGLGLVIWATIHWKRYRPLNLGYWIEAAFVLALWPIPLGVWVWYLKR